MLVCKVALEEMPLLCLFSVCLTEGKLSDKYVCCCRPSGKAIKCCTHAEMLVVYFSELTES